MIVGGTKMNELMEKLLKRLTRQRCDGWYLEDGKDFVFTYDSHNDINATKKLK